jgi:hypothetical protein
MENIVVHNVCQFIASRNRKVSFLGNEFSFSYREAFEQWVKKRQ